MSYSDAKIAELDEEIAAEASQRRTLLALHYTLLVPQVALNALMTGTALVDTGLFDAQTSRYLVGFAGVANVFLQGVFAALGLHGKAAACAERRTAMLLLRNRLQLARSPDGAALGDIAAQYTTLMSAPPCSD
jgi:hypothetical protein